jgi:hypothetical protein
MIRENFDFVKNLCKIDIEKFELTNDIKDIDKYGKFTGFMIEKYGNEHLQEYTENIINYFKFCFEYGINPCIISKAIEKYNIYMYDYILLMISDMKKNYDDIKLTRNGDNREICITSQKMWEEWKQNCGVCYSKNSEKQFRKYLEFSNNFKYYKFDMFTFSNFPYFHYLFSPYSDISLNEWQSNESNNDSFDKLLLLYTGDENKLLIVPNQIRYKYKKKIKPNEIIEDKYEYKIIKKYNFDTINYQQELTLFHQTLSDMLK